MQTPSVIRAAIKKNDGGILSDADDLLAAEEPMEVRLAWKDGGRQRIDNISVTMRTPGNDEELALGFLFTEGVIADRQSVGAVSVTKENVVLVTLRDGLIPNIHKTERNFYISSSCGVCGKASIDAIKTVCGEPGDYPYDGLRCTPELLFSLPEILRQQQSVFDQTGGIHACALFDASGKIVLLREDVGRHNALDKLVGAALGMGFLPAEQHILLLSGRASFELVQKAAMAGIKMIAAVGAPSSLAVQMAEEWNMTLVGFLRGQRFNIYAGGQRIVSGIV